MANPTDSFQMPEDAQGGLLPADSQVGISSPAETLYADLLQRYTASTDGKRLLASAICEVIHPTRNDLLLDLGAGDGILTSHLAERFGGIVAVDKNPRLATAFERNVKCAFHVGRMEDYADPRFFKLILMSYSLTGVPTGRLPSFLRRLRGMLAPGGKVLACTFSNDCKWAHFAREVSALLNDRLLGGTEEYTSLVANSGHRARILYPVQTKIWADDLESLTNLMSFFFIKRLSEYQDNTDAIVQLVERYSSLAPDGTRYMRVIENILEIV